MAADGITYEASAIARALALKLESPITKQKLASAVTYPNRNLATAVRYWLDSAQGKRGGVQQLQ